MPINNTPKVVLSTGIGRLHFVETVESLIGNDVDSSIVSGWVPSRTMMQLVKLLPAFGGYRRLEDSLTPRLRLTETGVPVHSLFLPEFERVVRELSARFTSESRMTISTKIWQSFGRKTIPFLRGDIFHARSGAGQGGAITAAKAKGMKVIVDQSLAHPEELSRNLRALYANYGASFDLGPELPFWQLVLQDCKDADVLLVNSDYVKAGFVEQGYEPDKIKVIYLGVRQDFAGLKNDYSLPEDGVLNLLFTGGFGFRKGANLIIEAMQQLLELGVKCRFEIAGHSEQGEEMLQGYSAELRECFHFHGFIPQDDLKQLLQRADIYVFPSYAEGCAKSAAEAMAAGLPVICTKETGMPVSNDETHFVVPRDDSGALASAIVELSKNEERRRQMGLAAAKMIKDRMTWQHYGQELSCLYRDLLTD